MNLGVLQSQIDRLQKEEQDLNTESRREQKRISTISNRLQDVEKELVVVGSKIEGLGKDLRFVVANPNEINDGIRFSYTPAQKCVIISSCIAGAALVGILRWNFGEAIAAAWLLPALITGFAVAMAILPDPNDRTRYSSPRRYEQLIRTARVSQKCLLEEGQRTTVEVEHARERLRRLQNRIDQVQFQRRSLERQAVQQLAADEAVRLERQKREKEEEAKFERLKQAKEEAARLEREAAIQEQRRFAASKKNWREMRDIEFEDFVQELFELYGYRVNNTRKSGDQGVDLVAKRENVSIAIQCKGWSSSVGNSAVQEAVAGRAHYGCSEAWCVTNSSFTRNAVALARSNNCRLIDGGEIVRILHGDISL